MNGKKRYASKGILKDALMKAEEEEFAWLPFPEELEYAYAFSANFEERMKHPRKETKEQREERIRAYEKIVKNSKSLI